jgi:hypothetical protein
MLKLVASSVTVAVVSEAVTHAAFRVACCKYNQLNT